MSTEHTYTPTGPTTPCKSVRGLNVDTPDGAAEAVDLWMRDGRPVLRVKRGGEVFVYFAEDCEIGVRS